MCPRRYLDAEKGFLSYDLFKKIIDEISMHSNIALIPFFRGESLLHPDFISMLRYIKTKGIAPIQIATNGILFDEKISETILDLGVDFVSFSFHDLNDDTYNRVHIVEDCDVVAKNIELFLKKKRDKNTKLPEIQVSIVETERTKNYVSTFISKWIKKVDRVRIYKEHSFEGNFGCLKDNEILYFSNERKPCLKLITEIAIYWNGDVAICNHDWNRRRFLANINSSSIENVWNSDKYHQLRKMHFEGQADGDVTCGRCDHWRGYYFPDGMIGQLYTRAGK
jgi:radical SAM protein with 4Fe4S-binding SPASM domain